MAKAFDFAISNFNWTETQTNKEARKEISTCLHFSVLMIIE